MGSPFLALGKQRKYTWWVFIILSRGASSRTTWLSSCAIGWGIGSRCDNWTCVLRYQTPDNVNSFFDYGGALRMIKIMIYRLIQCRNRCAGLRREMVSQSKKVGKEERMQKAVLEGNSSQGNPPLNNQDLNHCNQIHSRIVVLLHPCLNGSTESYSHLLICRYRPLGTTGILFWWGQLG